MVLLFVGFKRWIEGFVSLWFSSVKANLNHQKASSRCPAGKHRVSHIITSRGIATCPQLQGSMTFQSSYPGHACQTLVILQTTPRATGLCFQGRRCFDLADWPPLCSALARTFSKTWKVKRSFMLTLLQLYHYTTLSVGHSWALGAPYLAPPAQCHIWFALRWNKVWKPSGSYSPVCLERFYPS